MLRHASSPGFWIAAVWIAWAVSWTLAGFWANRTTARPPSRRELPYRLITLAGVILLMPISDGDHQAWRTGVAAGSIGLAMVVAGVIFAWWARIHLGRLWSGNVTRKAEHRVVDTGPYRLVRHPIYTGLLTSVIGTAVARGDGLGFAGAALIILGTYIKARLEESFLRQQLGADAYDGYAAKTPMLVPGAR